MNLRLPYLFVYLFSGCLGLFGLGIIRVNFLDFVIYSDAERIYPRVLQAHVNFSQRAYF